MLRSPIYLTIYFGIFFNACLLASGPEVELQLKKARTLSYDKQYTESIATYDRIIESNPSNLQALRERADVLSWAERYTESIEAYDQCLKAGCPTEAEVQKARVLGWSKHFDHSLEVYRDAYQHAGLEEIKLEGMAKRAMWDGWIYHALENYTLVLKRAPHNLEARLDRAQLQAYAGVFPQARSDYQKILSDSPWHFRAKDSLNKLNIVSNSFKATPSFSWNRARSTLGDSFYDKLSSSTDIEYHVLEDLIARAGYGMDYFFLAGDATLARHQLRIGVEKNFGPRGWASAMYAPTVYPSDQRFSHIFHASLGWRPLDPLSVSGFVLRDDLTNNRDVFINQLNSTEFGARVTADIDSRWKSSGVYKHALISDGNRENAVRVEQLAYLSYDPYRLTMNVSLDYQNWSENKSPLYFSPAHLFTVGLSAHWRHYLNADGLYYGVNNTYYGIKPTLQLDHNLTIFYGGELEFYHDFNATASLSLNGDFLYSAVYYYAKVALTAQFYF